MVEVQSSDQIVVRIFRIEILDWQKLTVHFDELIENPATGGQGNDVESTVC